MLVLVDNEWKSTMDLGYVSAFTEKKILQHLRCFSGITVHLLSRTLLFCSSPQIFLWDRLLLTFLELITSWWWGQVGFVQILHQHLQLCCSFPGNGLCLLKDCFHLFSSPVPVGGCLAIWAVQVEIAEPHIRHVSPRGHSRQLE